MNEQSTEMAWDISDWGISADLSASNIKYNLQKTFLSNGLILPASIICRYDQRNCIKQLSLFSRLPSNGSNVDVVDLGYGIMRLKSLPPERTEVTYRSSIYKSRGITNE